MRKQHAYLIAIHFIVSFSTISSAQMRGPDFLIIGAQKCGTTSLYNYLVKHPNIIPAKKKEIRFFDLNFLNGIQWYQEQLMGGFIKKNCLAGEATPIYFINPEVPQRVAEIYPEVKIILLLRNPIERAFSHYRMRARHWMSGRQIREFNVDFQEAIHEEIKQIKIEENKNTDFINFLFSHEYKYCTRGMYIYYIKNWMKYFPKEQFLILQSEEFFADPETTLKQVHAFLGIPHYSLKSYPKHKHNPSNIPLDEKIMAQLANFFRPYNKALEKFLGRKFNWDEE